MNRGTPSYGPVELDVILLDADGPSPALVRALAEQIREGVVRLLDFAIITRRSDEVTIREIEIEEFGLENLKLLIPGLIGEEDLVDLGEEVPEDGSAVVIALELLWAKELSRTLTAEGGVIVATERIPAPVVNSIVELAQED